MELKPAPHRTREQMETLVHEFEDTTLPNSEFNHHAHMTVAMWYLIHEPYADAVTHMRASVKRFAAKQGNNQLYNETITLFWLKLLRHLLDGAAPARPEETVYKFSRHGVVCSLCSSITARSWSFQRQQNARGWNRICDRWGLRFEILPYVIGYSCAYKPHRSSRPVRFVSGRTLA